MPPQQTGGRETLLMAAVLMALAAFFAIQQWIEIRRRPYDVSDLDAEHFSHKDRRRYLVAGILSIISVAMVLSTRIDFRLGRPAYRLWSWTWLSILGLALVLLILALLDWKANRAYAMRHYRALIDEHRELLTQALRRQATSRNGTPDRDRSNRDTPSS